MQGKLIIMTFLIDKTIILNGKIGKKMTMFLSSLIFSFVFLYWILRPALKLQYFGYISVIAIFLATLLSIIEKPVINKPNKLILICLVLLGVLYIIAAINFNEWNKLYKGLSFAIFVPFITYLLSSKNSRIRFINAFVNGGIFGIIFLSVMSAIKAPIFDVQYSSITLNPNYLSITASVMYVCGLYKLFSLRSSLSKLKLVLISVCIGLSLTLILLSQSRTGILCVITSTIIAVMVMIANARGVKRVGKFVKRFIAVVVICAITLPCFHTVINVVSSKAMAFEIEHLGRESFFSIDSFIEIDAKDLPSQDKSDTDFSDSIESALNRSKKGFGANKDDISTGRFGIWKSCFKSFNICGHSDSEKFYAPYRDTYIRNSHNMLLSIGYDTGYLGFIVIIAYLVCGLTLYFHTLRSVIRKREANEASFFFLTITPVFVIVGMLSDMFFPTLSIVSIPFWFTVPINKEY